MDTKDTAQPKVAAEAEPRDLDNVRQTFTVIALAVLGVIYVLGDSLPLAGRSSDEVLSQVTDAFFPAYYAFTIHTLIAAALTAYVVYQVLPANRKRARLRALAPLFWAFCVACAISVFAFHYEQVTLFVVAVLAQFGALAAATTVLARGPSDVDTGELWCVHVPFSVTFAWASVLLLCSVTHWSQLADVSLAREQPESWAILMVAVLTVFAGVLGWLRRDPLFLVTMLWALVAIVVRQGIPSPVSSAAIGGLIIIAAVTAYALRANRGQVSRLSRSPR